VRAKDRTRTRNGHTSTDRRALLLVDIDGVISLFTPAGAAIDATGVKAPPREIAGSLHSIDGMLHYLSSTAAAHLLSLTRFFELVWASGWEEKADEYLPHLLGLPAGMPFLRFARNPRGAAAGARAGTSTAAHWKLDAVERFAGTRPVAWIDDAFNPACHAWAAARTAPTLLVATVPERGLTDAEARRLERWAAELAAAPA
jgi:hypothetical protein